MSWHESLNYLYEKALQTNDDSCSWCRGRLIREQNKRVKKGSAINPPHIPQLCLRCAAEIPWIEHIVCEICGRAELCEDCLRRKNSSLDSNRSAVKYTDQMREWLARYKYRGDERLASVFQEMLMYAYQRLVFDHNSFGKSEQGLSGQAIILTFVPLSEERMKERGFNQARDMAMGIGRRLNLPVVSMLSRTKDTDKQSYKKRHDRYHTLKGIFQIHEAGWVETMKIWERHRNLRKWSVLSRKRAEVRVIQLIIVDDVYTTGSTMQHCARTILEAYSHKMDNLGIHLRISSVSWAR